MLDEGARALIAGILRESLDEYYENLVKLRKTEYETAKLELFFKSEWCYWLSSSIGIDMKKCVDKVVELSEQQTEGQKR